MEETDQCPEVWSQPNPQPSFHAVVVPDHQQSQRQYNHHFPNVSIILLPWEMIKRLITLILLLYLGVCRFPGAT